MKGGERSTCPPVVPIHDVDSPMCHTMNPRTKVIKQLVSESHYVIDSAAVAEAIIVRALARRVLPDVTFRATPRHRPVRSFRPHRGARSFRLTRNDRRPAHGAGEESDAPHAL
jgi:hypothetical protein